MFVSNFGFQQFCFDYYKVQQNLSLTEDQMVVGAKAVLKRLSPMIHGCASLKRLMF